MAASASQSGGGAGHHHHIARHVTNVRRCSEWRVHLRCFAITVRQFLRVKPKQLLTLFALSLHSDCQTSPTCLHVSMAPSDRQHGASRDKDPATEETSSEKAPLLRKLRAASSITSSLLDMLLAPQRCTNKQSEHDSWQHL